jgi:hypothetical protein
MDRTEQLEEALQEELLYLWSDLSQAVNEALNGKWSMRCDNLVARIQTITQLVGVVPPERINFGLLREGVNTYEQVHAEIDVDIDRDELARCRAAAEDYFARARS